MDAVLLEVWALRDAEGADGTQQHWWGLVRSEVKAAHLGVGVTPDLVTATVTSAAVGVGLIDPMGPQILAHELAHNRGWLHSPCGVSVKLDPD